MPVSHRLRFIRFAQAASIAVMLAGFMALAGWALDIQSLRGILPGLTSMNPGGTAVSFILMGAALFLRMPEYVSPLRKTAAMLCIAAVLTILMTWLESNLSSSDTGLDQFLFRGKIDREALVTGHPNRMAPNTVIAFLLSALGFLLLDVRIRRIWPAQIMALAVGLVSLLTLLGYTYNSLALMAVHQSIPMALNTGICFGLVSIALLLMRPDRGLVSVIGGNGIGGMLARRMLPAAIVVPAALGWLEWTGQQRGYIDPVLGLSLFVLTNTVIFTVLIWWNAHAMENAERRMKESEERYALAVRGARDGLWDWNVRTDALYWSDRFLEMLDIARENFEPHYDEFKKRLHPEDRDRIVTELENHTKTRAPYDAEFRMIRDSGETIWLRARGASVWGDDGRAIRMTGSVTDITDRKAAENALVRSSQELQTSEKRYELALKGSNDGLWDRDMITGALYWSDRILEMLGIADPDFKPHYDEFKRRLHPDDRERVLEAQRRHAANRTPYDTEYRIRTEAGDYIWVRVRGQGIWNDDGVMVRMLGSVSDISERKQADLDLEYARRTADKANQTKSEFLANMSHELRTPLNSIIGLTRMLYEDKMVAEEPHEIVGIVYRSAKNLLDIVNDILDLSKVESGMLVLENITFSLEEVMDNIMETILPLSSERGLIFTCNFANERLPYLLGDPVRLERILINLIGNAVKYTERGSVTVDIDLQPTADNAIMLDCRVTDTGIGIPKDKQALIFEKFEQADSSITRKFGGTGLGLNITKQLVVKMGGMIGVESEEGKGSRFWVKIPFQTADIRPIIDKRTFQRAPIERLPESRRKPAADMHILLAEDHALNQAFMRKLLKRLGFQNFDIVENGQQVLNAIESRPYDIILMDCHMPVFSGYDATKEIRLREKQSDAHIPIIAMTADAMLGTRERCLKAGMDDYISKPVNQDELRHIMSIWTTFPDEKAAPMENTAPKTNDDSQLDFSMLLEFADNNDEIRRFTDIFTKQSEEILQILQQSCVDGESDAWVQAAHKLKGGASIIQAKKLIALCEQGQKMIVATAADRAFMLKRIEEAYNATQAGIDAYFKAQNI